MNLALEGLSIGHYTNTQGGTGITVFIPDYAIPCGWWLAGASPATRDVNLLDPAAHVATIDALAFTGGSAYGLGATNGVMRWLNERQRGYKTPHGLVPIVPTAGIYDLGVNGLCIPTPEEAYTACQNATNKNTLQGRVGAGTGASVGKWKRLAQGRAMSGGFGCCELVGPNGLAVLACVVVNSVGDVIDMQGNVVAGAVKPDGSFADIYAEIAAGEVLNSPINQQNTTLAAIFTNAIFDKAQLTRIAKMTSAGLARATRPAFTRYDGDVIFSTALGQVQAEEVAVGTLAAYAAQRAILNAVQDSIVI